jgi:DMSO/TMAO reductase YedYZ molybdopterin-dependent catalytic subunit
MSHAKNLSTSILAATVSLVTAGAAGASPSSSLTVTGDILDPATYTASSLAALPQVSESVSYTASGSPVTATYSGPTIESLVAAAQINTNLTLRNAIVPFYATATSSNGSQIVYALSEIDPRFAGGGPTPPLIATSVNGGSLGANGFATTTAPRDLSNGRYLPNVVNLDIEPAAPIGPVPTAGGVPASFILSGQVANPGSYTLANLQAMPSVTETTTFLGMHGSVTATYQGVSLWNLLNAAGIVTTGAVDGSILDEYVLLIGTDGFESLVSLGEIDPQYGGQPDILAYNVNGAGLGDDGFAELVVPGDTFGGRYVYNIASIQVLDAASPNSVPEPGSLPLLASALAGLIAFSRSGPARRIMALVCLADGSRDDPSPGLL